jgi:hypothetical protein
MPFSVNVPGLVIMKNIKKAEKMNMHSPSKSGYCAPGFVKESEPYLPTLSIDCFSLKEAGEGLSRQYVEGGQYMS